MDSDRAVGQRCGDPLADRQNSGPELAAPSGELVAIQLGHCVVHIQHQLSSQRTQRQRTYCCQVRQRADYGNIIDASAAQLERTRCCSRQKRCIAAQITTAAAASIARSRDAEQAHPISERGARFLQTDRVYMVATCGEGIGVTFDAGITRKGLVSDHQDSQHQSFLLVNGSILTRLTVAAVPCSFLKIPDRPEKLRVRRLDFPVPLAGNRWKSPS